MLIRALVGVVFLGIVAPLPPAAWAEDCVLPTPAFRRSGILDPNVWICPVRLTTEGTPTSGPNLPMGVPTYWLGEVLDQRACPVSDVRALFIPGDWDAVPALAQGQTMLFLVPPERYDYQATDDAEGIDEASEGTLDIRADADSCTWLTGWSTLGEHWDSFGVDPSTSDELIAVRSPNSDDMAWPPANALADIEYLLLPDSTLWFARDSTDPAESMSWGQLLERRAHDPLSRGENGLDQEFACRSTERATIYHCQFDSDCAVCHDGSACGTIRSLDEVLLEGVDCELPDSAECEMSAPRCCNERCVRAPF